MSERASEYRAKLGELRERGGRRWRAPERLREEIAAWASDQRSEGYALSGKSEVIGVSETTLGRWMSSRERSGELRRVGVATEAEQSSGRGLVLVTPGGYRLEGLSVDEAVNVLRRL